MKEDVAAIFDNMETTGVYLEERFRDAVNFVDTKGDLLKEEVDVIVATRNIEQNGHLDEQIETLTEHIDNKFGEVDNKIAAIDSKFGEMDNKITAIEASIEDKIALLMTELDIIRSILQPASATNGIPPSSPPSAAQSLPPTAGTFGTASVTSEPTALTTSGSSEVFNPTSSPSTLSSATPTLDG